MNKLLVYILFSFFTISSSHCSGTLHNLGKTKNKSQYFVYIEPEEEIQEVKTQAQKVKIENNQTRMNDALNDLILENQKLQRILKEKLLNKKKRMMRVKKTVAKKVQINKRPSIVLPSARRYVREDFDSLLKWEDEDEPKERDIKSSHPAKTKKYKTPAEFLEQDSIMFEEVKEESLNNKSPIYRPSLRNQKRVKRKKQRSDIFETLDYVALSESNDDYDGIRATYVAKTPQKRQKVRIRRKHKNLGRKKTNFKQRGKKLTRNEKISLWNFQMGVRNPGSTNSNDLGNDGIYYQISKQMKNGHRAFVEYKQWKVKNSGNGKFHSTGIGWKHYYEKYNKDRKVNPYVAGVVDHVNGSLNNYNGVAVKQTRSKVQATARIGAEIRLDQFLNMDIYLERGGQTIEFVDANGVAIPLKSKNTIYGLGLNYLW
ncbi:MAG: hypothetical protein COB02_11490 [Candidatus Cloacimonadota bacterium]|nr:MAG: hypothetical protein COB02_11490 [Candidatus Cloacimonadota bacterium]